MVADSPDPTEEKGTPVPFFTSEGTSSEWGSILSSMFHSPCCYVVELKLTFSVGSVCTVYIDSASIVKWFFGYIPFSDGLQGLTQIIFFDHDRLPGKLLLPRFLSRCLPMVSGRQQSASTQASLLYFIMK